MFELISNHPVLTCASLAVGVCLGLLVAAAAGDRLLDVVLLDAGPRRIQVIKALRDATGLGLGACKALSERPGAVVASLPPEGADLLAEALQRAGARVRIDAHRGLPGERVRVCARVRVGSRQRVFVHRRHGFERALQPGRHWVWGRAGLVRVTVVDGERLAFPDLDAYLADGWLRHDTTRVDLREGQRALVWQSGRLLALLGPGRHVLWDTGQVDEELLVHPFEVTAAAPRFEHPHLDAALRAPAHGAALREAVVPVGHVGLLRIDGRSVERLPPGRYALWEGVARVAVELVDMRQRAVEVQALAWTRDRVELTMTVSADFKVHSALQATDALSGELGEALCQQLAQAVGLAASQRSFDELAAQAVAFARDVQEQLGPRLRGLGISLLRVGLGRLDPPGDVRALLIQAVEARTRAEVERITRREETAAARSQLNTARLLERSPELRRLRELEAAERIAGAVGELRVTAGGGGLTRITEQLLPRA